ncbi:restriction endonuclease subunit S [Acinetobacter piscicola]|uniref:restriction endonuclease subunit S n=1 Tax=Acinetobacter piscicola TaxID=2006115 RepID=UPI00101F0366|nr:restriction endonuclease subunit S [Acinetobacter piscicola]RYL29578.1 restriction endonuclease subunit S [Acinetobacter piscicola]
MTAPKLRFKEFDGDWIKADIQSLVDEKIIDKPMDGNHGEIHPTSADYVEDGIPFVMATDVVDGKVHLGKSKKIQKSQADSLRKGFSLAGDILLTHKATIGNVAKVPELKTPYIMLTPQVTYYRVLNKDKLTADFIKSSFEAPIFQSELLALCTGATRLYIGISEQRKLPFSYPSKEEQTKIASFLSAVDEKISQLTQKHSLLSQYKQGMMQKLFSQQIRFKADDGSEFGEWEEKNLVDISNIITGTTPETANKSFYNGAYLFVSPVDIQDNRYISQTKTTLTESGFRKCRAIPKNSILFVCIGSTIGKVAQNKKICTTNQQINAVIPNDGYCVDYVYFQLLFQAESIKLKAGTQAVPIINKTEFGKTTLRMPCLEEQTKIANFLSAIEQKIEVVVQQIEQAKQWKKGLLQQMFV